MAVTLHEQPRTRWRIIPAYFLIMFGGLVFILSVLNLLLMLAGIAWPHIIPWQSPFRAAAAMILMLVSSVFWSTSGYMILRSRWGRMLLTLAIAYIVGALALWLLESTLISEPH
jgi:hypothetical protein